MVEINLTEKNFEQEVLKEEKLVLVDFWASWCGPCQMLAPVLSQFAEEYKDKLKVGKVNVDEQRDLAIKYNITSIPTLILFKNGEIVNVSVGFHSKAELKEIVNI